MTMVMVKPNAHEHQQGHDQTPSLSVTQWTSSSTWWWFNFN